MHGFTLKTPVQFKRGLQGKLCPRLGKHEGVGMDSGGPLERCGGSDVGGYTLIWRGNSNQLGGYTARL